MSRLLEHDSACEDGREGNRTSGLTIKLLVFGVFEFHCRESVFTKDFCIILDEIS